MASMHPLKYLRVTPDQIEGEKFIRKETRTHTLYIESSDKDKFQF